MRLIITYLLLSIQTFVFGQEFTYTHYDIKDGMAGSTVYCSVQDKDNFMWFGTETGLSRFDGSKFTNLGIKEGMPDNEVLKLFCDSQNRIWCTLFKEEICYVLNGKIHNKYNDSVLKKITLKGIAWQVCEDKKGNVLIREDEALHIIAVNNSIKNIYCIESNTINNFSSVSQSLDGNFFVCVNKSVYELNAKGETKLIKKLEVDGNLMRDTKLDKHFIFWLPNRFSFGVYSFENNNEKILTGPPSIINQQFLKDSFLCFNKTDGCTIINLFTNDKIDSILPGEPVSSVCNDFENGLWFTTIGHGIFRLSSVAFKTFSFTKENGSKLAIFSIAKYGSEIFAGAENSYLFKFNDSSLGYYNHFKIHFPFEVKNRIVSIQHLNDTFYLGSDLALIRTSTFKKEQLIDFLTVKKILPLNGDTLLVASKNCLLLINAHSLKITDTLLNERVTCFNSINNKLYVGTLAALKEINLTDKKHSIINLPVPNARITVLEKGLDNTLWIGTNGAGVFAYKDGKFISSISEAEGLSSNVCRCITAYKNLLWVGTDKGVSKIIVKPSPHILSKFTNTDGLPSNIINAIFQDSKYVYIGSSEGLTYFDDDATINTSKCALHITDIISGTDTVNKKNILIYPKKRNIRLDYVAISYNSVGDILYYYRLKGLQNDWQVTNNTSINYASLPGGDYLFEIKAINKYGVESKSISIPFKVEKVIWEQTWFRISSLLLLGLIIWIVMMTQIKRIKRKEIEKNNTRKQIADLKQKALKSQISPHFIFNSLNSIQHYIIDNDLEGSNIFLSRFSELIRKTLEFSEKQEISIKEELNYLNTFLLLEQERFENNFKFKIIVASEVEIENSFIPPLILQPLVENSIKHGVMIRNDCSGIIEIKAELNDSKIILTVTDNGPGIYHSQDLKKNKLSSHTSMGISLVQGRIQALSDITGKKSSISIEEVNEHDYYPGTKIIIKIPLL